MAQHPGYPRGDASENSSSTSARPLTPQEDRQWAMLSHFGAFLGAIPSLVIFMVMRDRGPFTAQESKEALNFTLPLTVVAVVANLLALLPIIGAVFGVVAVLLWLFMTISGVVAGIEVNKGRPYRYPFNLRLIN